MDQGQIIQLSLILVVSFCLSFIGSAVGLVLGHLRLPMLINYLGSTPAGTLMNLIISGCGAFGGTIGHIRNGRISWIALAMMGIPSCLGALLAIWIVIHIHPVWSYFCIGIILILSGLSMVRKKVELVERPPIPKSRQILVEIVIGLGLGGLAAMTGLMLGSLRLPMMLKYLRMDPKEAVGTNMAVGCMTAIVGGIAGLVAGTGRIDWLVMSVLVPATFVGGYSGGILVGRISKEVVQRMAGWVIVITGVILIGQGGTILWRKKTQTTVPPAIIDEADEDWIHEFDYITTDDIMTPGTSVIDDFRVFPDDPDTLKPPPPDGKPAPDFEK